jgi:hypothetical protein
MHISDSDLETKMAAEPTGEIFTQTAVLSSLTAVTRPNVN